MILRGSCDNDHSEIIKKAHKIEIQKIPDLEKTRQIKEILYTEGTSEMVQKLRNKQLREYPQAPGEEDIGYLREVEHDEKEQKRFELER